MDLCRVCSTHDGGHELDGVLMCSQCFNLCGGVIAASHCESPAVDARVKRRRGRPAGSTKGEHKPRTFYLDAASNKIIDDKKADTEITASQAIRELILESKGVGTNDPG